jgi:hypothetical protein
VRTLVNDVWFLPIMGTAIASSKVMRILCMIRPCPSVQQARCSYKIKKGQSAPSIREGMDRNRPTRRNPRSARGHAHLVGAVFGLQRDSRFKAIGWRSLILFSKVHFKIH